MAKYVARVRKDANSYRYFYSPAEYQAYIKAKGKAIGDKITDTVSSAKKKVHKYVYNKNASKKLNEMGKAHEIDERAKQSAQGKVTPSDHRDKMTDKSIVNRRTMEAVVGGQFTKSKKPGEGYVHSYSGTTPKTKETLNSPNVGKMQDAMYKSLNAKQQANVQKEQHKKNVTKRMNDAADKRAYTNGYKKVDDPKLPNTNVLRYTESGPAADAKAKTKEADAKRTQSRSDYITKQMNKNRDGRNNYVSDKPTGNMSNMDDYLTLGTKYHRTGPAYDEAMKAKEQKTRQTNARINKGINDQGKAHESEVRRKEYDVRNGISNDEPPVYKPSTYEKMHKEYIRERNKKAEENRDKRAGVGHLTGGTEILKERGVAADEAAKTYERMWKREQDKKKKKYVK